MQMEHNFIVPAPVGAVWDALLDLERVVPCLPGASLTSFTGEEFAGTVQVRLGPISLRYQGSGKLTETDARAHRVVVEASGKDSRGNGTASATVTASLREEDEGTAVTVVTDLTVTGKPAQFGRGLISEVGGKIIGQFADCLAGALDSSQGAPAGPAESEEPPVTPAPGTAAAAPAGSTTPGQHAAAAASPLRTVPAPASEEIDLLDAAGGSVLKRVAPVAGGLLVLLLLVRRFRRR